MSRKSHLRCTYTKLTSQCKNKERKRHCSTFCNRDGFYPTQTLTRKTEWPVVSIIERLLAFQLLGRARGFEKLETRSSLRTWYSSPQAL